METKAESGRRLNGVLPRVILSETVYRQIMFWVDLCPDEISGLGRVVKSKDKDGIIYRVEEVFLLKQVVTASTTEMDKQAVKKLLYEHFKEDRKGSISFWWHSHVNMGVFWSETDYQAMEGLLEGPGFLVSTVFNKQEDTRTAVYSRLEDGAAYFMDDIEMSVARPEFFTQEEIADMTQQYKEKVRKQVFEAELGNKWRSHPSIGFGNSYTSGLPIHSNTTLEEDIAEDDFAEMGASKGLYPSGKKAVQQLIKNPWTLFYSDMLDTVVKLDTLDYEFRQVNGYGILQCDGTKEERQEMAAEGYPADAIVISAVVNKKIPYEGV